MSDFDDLDDDSDRPIRRRQRQEKYDKAKQWMDQHEAEKRRNEIDLRRWEAEKKKKQ